MQGTRRRFLEDAAVLGVGLFAAGPGTVAKQESTPAGGRVSGSSAARRVPMITPDVPDMPFVMDGAVKVFRLRAAPMKQKIAPFRTIDVWGYNGSCPGPTIQVNQGDRVRVLFENGLPESSTLHWHGLEVPIEQDGVPYISQMPVPPGGSYTYEFDVHQEGTFFYHAHTAMQEMIGQLGMFIAHPQKPYSPHVDHDYGIVLQEWAVLPSNSVPNTSSMEYNWLTFNGVSAPMTTPLIAKLGSRVRLRFVNLGMDHHPIHLHGNQFVLTGTEGGRARKAPGIR